MHQIFRLIESTLNKTADVLLTSSSAARDDLVNRWNIPDQSVIPLIDAVDMTVFKPYPREASRKKLGIPTDVTVIVFLGVLNSYQGIDLLLEALVTVMSADSNVHALIMGYPEEGYRRMADELNIGSRTTFTGKIPYDRAAEYISAGDLAVSPKLSRTEANGKLFNYMACGLPVVVFDNEINREILGDSAWYIQDEDSESLATALLAAISNRDTLQQYGNAARDRAIQLHSWNSRIVRLVQAYARLLAYLKSE